LRSTRSTSLESMSRSITTSSRRRIRDYSRNNSLSGPRPLRERASRMYTLLHTRQSELAQRDQQRRIERPPELLSPREPSLSRRTPSLSLETRELGLERRSLPRMSAYRESKRRWLLLSQAWQNEMPSRQYPRFSPQISLSESLERWTWVLDLSLEAC